MFVPSYENFNVIPNDKVYVVINLEPLRFIIETNRRMKSVEM